MTRKARTASALYEESDIQEFLRLALFTAHSAHPSMWYTLKIVSSCKRVLVDSREGAWQ